MREWKSGAMLLLGAALAACGGGGAEERSRAVVQAPSELRASNRPPVIDRVVLDPASPAAGDRVRAVVEVSDPDGDPVQLGYAWSLSGQRLAGGGPSIEMPVGERGDRLEVRVTASDGKAESAPMLGIAGIANRRPRLLEVRLEPEGELAAGDSVSVIARAEDPDGDRLDFEYRWSVNGRPVAEEGPSLSSRGLQRGDRIQARVVATDGDARSEALESAVRVANGAPRITSSPPGGLEDGEFVYPVEAEDPDGDRALRFRLLEGPPGMAIDPVLGELRWRPAAYQLGAHPVDVAVSDPQGASSAQRFEITLRETEETPPASQR